MFKKNNPKLIFFCFVIFSAAISFFNIAVFSYKKYLAKQVAPEVKAYTNWSEAAVYDEIAYWQEFLKTNAEYVPGWVEMARLQVKVKDLEGAKYSIQTAKRINPFYEDIAKVSENIKLLSAN